MLRICIAWLLAFTAPAFGVVAVPRRGHPVAGRSERLPTYTTKFIGRIEDQASHAYALNRRGEVVGAASPGWRFCLFANGEWRDLEARAFHPVGTSDLNARGEVVGQAWTRAGMVAYRYHQGTARVLEMPGGPPSMARAINDAGAVVGWFTSPEADGIRAFLTADGNAIDLGTLGGDSEALGVNARGQVVGASETSPGRRHAFLWSRGRMRDLGTLGGVESAARSLNDAGVAVGWSLLPNRRAHACLWNGTRKKDLGTLGGRESWAYDINNAGDVVGLSQIGKAEFSRGMAPPTRAFLYHNGVMHDLNRLLPRDSGWVLLHASSINERGQITGDGRYLGRLRAFLLTPKGRDAKPRQGWLVTTPTRRGSRNNLGSRT